MGRLAIAVAMLAIVVTACGSRRTDSPAGDRDGGARADASSIDDSGSPLPDASFADAGRDAGPRDAGTIIIPDVCEDTGLEPGPVISAGVGVLEAEPHVAVSSSGDVVAVWISEPLHVAYSVSHNRGSTWTSPAILDTGEMRAGDPTVAVDSTGAFYAAWMEMTGTVPDVVSHVFVARLAPGSSAFGVPVEASDPSARYFLDKPWVLVDNRDAVLVTWFNASRFALVVGRSTDGGASFARFDAAMISGLAYPCIDREGGAGAPIYVVYHDDTGEAIGLAKSTDGGTSWSVPSRSIPGDRAAGEDSTCVVHGEDLWLAYARGAGDTVRVIHSPNGGATYDRVVDAAIAPTGSLALLPQLVRTASGTLDLIYYRGAIGGAARVTRSSSTDGGETWRCSDLGAAGMTAFTRDSALWWGDYLGVSATDGALYIAHSDNSSGFGHIRFLTIPDP